MLNRYYRRILFIALLICAPVCVFAADVLEEVPNDALGFVLLHNIATVDAKVGQLASKLGRDLPQPLAFLKEVTGVGEGIDPQGDFLLVLLPTKDEKTKIPRFCVWLPVADYDQLIQSLGATPGEGMIGVTVAGEDLLVGRRDDWALVMDPDERDRMKQLLDAPSTPPLQLRDWKAWILQNDATVVAFSSGIHQIRGWLAAGGPAAAESNPGGDSESDIFGAAEAPQQQDAFTAPGRRRSPSDILVQLQSEFQKWTVASPELTSAMTKVDVLGCGVRLDENGNALASVRVALNKEQTPDREEEKTPRDFPPALYEGGGFILNGAGRLPSPAAKTIASAYVHRLVADLGTEEHTQLDKTTVHRLQQAAAEAASDVRSLVVLTQPGNKPQAVYVNDFVVLRVASAAEFVNHATEVMRLWNQANREAAGETRLVFEVEELKIANRPATQYSLDFAALVGTVPPLPEVRQAMEKFFGPGGKLRMWIVPVDDATVLLAMATPEQVAAALGVLDHKRPIDWSAREISEPNRLLPTEADWRLFFSPHAYYDWLRRQTDAIVGVPVIGGPLVKDFPASPPIGIAGGFRDSELRIEVAAPADTVKSAGAFLKK